MRRKYVILPGKELFFACERLLIFRYPKPRVRSFRRDTRASRATSFIISTAFIWYTVLFRQNRDFQANYVTDCSILVVVLLSIFLITRNPRKVYSKLTQQLLRDAVRSVGEVKYVWMLEHVATAYKDSCVQMAIPRRTGPMSLVCTQKCSVASCIAARTSI
jgi:hypothetical protein